MTMINVKDDYVYDLVAKGINPTQFVNRLLDQHFCPWKYAEYENELIERVLERLEPTEDDLEVIKKYLSYEILRDFKTRMHRRYEHSLPIFSLEYYMKRLSIAVVERNFNQEKVEKYYSGLLKDITQRDPDFNLRTYIDNMLRLRYLPNSQRKIINKIEEVEMTDPIVKKISRQLKTRKPKPKHNKW